MKFAPTCVGMGVAILLAACAHRSSDTSAPVGPEPTSGPPELPLQTPLQARQAPIVPLEDTIHVGADVAAAPDALPEVARHGATRVAHGTVTDGVGADELIAYLEADAASLQEDEDDGMTVDVIPGGLLLRFAATPPTVYVAEGTRPELVDETVRAVQAINAALPENWQLGFSRDPATADDIDSPEGKIVVRFALQIEWPRGFVPPTGKDVGVAIRSFSIVPTGDPEMPFRIEIVAGRVFVDHTQTKGIERLGVIAHELIHLLGRNHVDAYRFPGTIMVDSGSKELTEHILHPLDREALLAVYSRLGPGSTPGDIANELGDWSDTSLHVQGALDIEDGEISFGAALRNGLSQPWASGPSPHANLEDNTGLSGNVSWSGRLVGLTPDAEAVAGAADLSVDLETLAGTADFTGLEQWAADAAPGAAGTGATWYDGDLSYGIEVRGNTFVQTGGDDGTVTGAFFGPAHEGMGGVLERDDLSAGFGGKR
ncbi:MAG: hypothetical protein OXN81_14725 [Alphaproteobacteria bacterium]|nr:hypothetical protein [Alphaproteobacteria bacterium]